MAISLIKNFTTTCVGQLHDAIKDLNLSTTLEQVKTVGSTTEFWFTSDLGADEEAQIDALLSTWTCVEVASPDVNEGTVYHTIENLVAREIKDITVPGSINGSVARVTNPSYQELTNETLLSADGSGPVGWDPFNVTSLESRINNGNYTDIVYNNTSAGNTTGIIFGIDMQTPTTINAVKKWDYSNTYFDRQWEFIGTNDPNADTYTTIFTESQDSPYVDDSNPFFRAFSDQTFRYFGIRTLNSNNSTYTILKEMELLSGTLRTVEKNLVIGTDYEISKVNADQFSIKNLKDTAQQFKIVIIGT